MTNAIIKTSKTLKTMTSTMRYHLDAVERAREIYLAHIKRAEADYFERIKRATESVVGEQESSIPMEQAPAPQMENVA